MQEHTRRHERIEERKLEGMRFTITDILPKPVDVFVPQKPAQNISFDLVFHFHGAPFVVQHAVTEYSGGVIAATINLGAGSRVYENGFQDSSKFESLVQAIHDSVSGRLGMRIRAGKIYLTAFSAGYGAVRKILSVTANYEKVGGVLLLDGIHAGYIPDRRVLVKGGVIDSTLLEVFLRLASEASKPASTKKFLITHSEIFPGTFVSTTEATDYLLGKLRIPRTPVLQWGPLGMQQLSETRRGHFAVLGFAGNTAPDHIDHYHALFHFLKELHAL